LKLREITRDIIRLVEERSGFPVQVLEDPDLPVIAQVRMARGTAPSHFVFYKPSEGESPDYTICHQCGFILRLFANPPEQRWELAGARTGQAEIEGAILAPDGPARRLQLGRDDIAQLRSHLMSSIMVHLRSVPIGLRISVWLADSYPELAELQRAQVTAELALAKETLKPAIREATPDLVYRPVEIINAAFALFWAQRYGQPEIANPYRHAHYGKDGQALLKIWNELPDDPLNDRELVDTWADYLGVRTWYTWIRYEPPA
jgi:hypothetical protein